MVELARALHDLAEEPRDARGPDWGVENADEVFYRLGLKCLAVPRLPNRLAVGGVTVEFVRGPVLAQRTDMRQRFGLPIVFDKVMTRSEVGAGELICLASIHEAPPPSDLEEAFKAWRSQVLAAAGLLAAVLDERVAGDEIFEDAVFLQEGACVGAADLKGMVRTFLPFEIDAPDRFALEQLAAVSIAESSSVARAARLYRRAALEGPTADAYATLWMAAECLSEHRSPSRKDIEAALHDEGMNPDGLPIHVGKLIDLRGKIQHHGIEASDDLETAFYEMEGVVRTLIRREAKLAGGWWPAADNVAAFAEPFDHAIAPLHGRGTTQWHQFELPPFEDPEPIFVPRRAVKAARDPRLSIDPNLGGLTSVIATVLLDAIEWIDPTLTLEILGDRPPEADSSSMLGANSHTVWIASEVCEAVEDKECPHALIRLIWDLVAAVGFAVAQRDGIVSSGNGVAVVQAIGSWFQFQRLVTYGEFPADFDELPVDDDPLSLGTLAGWSAAGDLRARTALDQISSTGGEFARDLAKSVAENMRLAAPVDLLEHAPQMPGRSQSTREGDES